MSVTEIDETFWILLAQEGFLGIEWTMNSVSHRLLMDTPLSAKVTRILLRQWSTLMQFASQKPLIYGPSLGDEKSSGLSVEIPLPWTYSRGERNATSKGDSGGVHFDFILKRLVATLKGFLAESIEELEEINKQKEKAKLRAPEVDSLQISSQSSVAKEKFIEFLSSGGHNANVGYFGWDNKRNPERISEMGDTCELLLRVIAQCSDCSDFGAPRHLEEQEAHFLSTSEKVLNESSGKRKILHTNTRTRTSSLFSTARGDMSEDMTNSSRSSITNRFRPPHIARLLNVNSGISPEAEGMSIVRSLVSLFDAALLWYSKIRSKTGWIHSNSDSLSIDAAEKVIKPLLLVRSYLVVPHTARSTSQDGNDDVQNNFIIDRSTTAADVLCSESVHLLMQEVVCLRLPYVEACGNVLRILLTFNSTSTTVLGSSSKKKKKNTKQECNNTPPTHFLLAITFIEDSIASLRPVREASEIVSWISTAETLSSERFFGFGEIITSTVSSHFLFRDMLFDALVSKVQSLDRSNFMDLHLIAWCSNKGQSMTIQAINAIREKYKPHLSACPILQKLCEKVVSTTLKGEVTPQSSNDIDPMEVTLELTLCSLISTVYEAYQYNQQNRTAFVSDKDIPHNAIHGMSSLLPITAKSLFNGIFYGCFYLSDIEKHGHSSPSPNKVSNTPKPKSLCGISAFRTLHLLFPMKTINNCIMSPLMIESIKNTSAFLKTNRVLEERIISDKLDETIPVALFIVELVRKWSIGVYERTILSLSTTDLDLFGSATSTTVDWSLALFYCSTMCCTLLSHCTDLSKEFDSEKEKKAPMYHFHFSHLLTAVTFLIPVLFDTLLVTSVSQLKMSKSAIDIIQRKYMTMLKEIIHDTVCEMSQLVRRSHLMWVIARLKEGDWGIDGKPPKWISAKSNVPRKSSSVTRILEIKTYTMIVPLEVLTMRETVDTTTDREILEIYVPVALCAIQSSVSLNVLKLGFAVLIAPILSHRPISPLLIPTIVAIYCPNLEEMSHRLKNSIDGKTLLWPYPFPSIQQLNHFALNIKSVMLALERCPSTSSGVNLAAFLKGNTFVSQMLEDLFQKQKAMRGNNEDGNRGTFGELCGAISPSSAQLYVIQSLFANTNFIVVKYFAKMGNVYVPSNINYQLFGTYMTALCFCVQCEDANVVARCCAALEVLLKKLSKRECMRWLSFIEDVIATSKSDTTRVDLATWLLGLRNTIIRSKL